MRLPGPAVQQACIEAEPDGARLEVDRTSIHIFEVDHGGLRDEAFVALQQFDVHHDRLLGLPQDLLAE